MMMEVIEGRNSLEKTTIMHLNAKKRLNYLVMRDYFVIFAAKTWTRDSPCVQLLRHWLSSRYSVTALQLKIAAY